MSPGGRAREVASGGKSGRNNPSCTVVAEARCTERGGGDNGQGVGQTRTAPEALIW